MPRTKEPTSPIQKFRTVAGTDTYLVLEHVIAWTEMGDGETEVYLMVLCEGGLSLQIIADADEFAEMMEDVLTGEG